MTHIGEAKPFRQGPPFWRDWRRWFHRARPYQKFTDSLARYREVWSELAKRDGDKGSKIAFENCALGGNWTTGNWNIADNPNAWEPMFNEAVETARPVLGISASAWEDAKVAMGEQQAGIALAAIHQRVDQIKSPGGYLRNLTERAKEGKFSTWPMIMALLRAKLDAAKAGVTGAGEVETQFAAAQRLDRTGKRLEISDTLRRSIDKWEEET